MMFSVSRTMQRSQCRQAREILVPLLVIAVTLSGCGSTKSNVATEQMLNSGAVDAAVAKIDFTPLRGQLVYFDTQYIADYKGVGFVNSQYVISALRQQMAAAGLLLQPKLEEADYVVEGRLGTLGSDSHEVVYGIPSNSALNAAASAATMLSGVPAPAVIPELSVARRNEQSAAAKIGVFAYDRVSREAVWQSGISMARSTARDSWIFGVGPFQRGTIYNGKTRLPGDSMDAPVAGKREGYNGPIVGYRDETIFRLPERKSPEKLAEQTDKSGGKADEPEIKQASGESRPTRPQPGVAKVPDAGKNK